MPPDGTYCVMFSGRSECTSGVCSIGAAIGAGGAGGTEATGVADILANGGTDVAPWYGIVGVDGAPALAPREYGPPLERLFTVDGGREI